MNNNSIKLLLVGILICLAIIAFKPTPTMVTQPAISNPNINIDNGQQVIQLAPNRIAVVDNRVVSGTRGTILVFEYNDTKKSFDFIGDFNYSDYFSNPQKYNLPLN